MKLGDRNWLAWAVLAVGIGLRVALAWVMPPNLAYDDHFTPIRNILESGRLPDPNACWECYQPPLYYVISAGVFGAAAGANQGRPAPIIANNAMKAVQYESLLFGCATLFVCWGVLRRALGLLPAAANGASFSGRWRAHATEALALAVVAFLPQHIYMSAMASNDALTYLLASLAIWAALRAHANGWSTIGAVLTGAFCGATVLSKGYGLVTAGVVVGTAGLAALARTIWGADAGAGNVGVEAVPAPASGRSRDAARGAARSGTARMAKVDGSRPQMPLPGFAAASPGRAWRAVALVAAAALAVGIWPSVRNYAWCGRPLVDNFDIWPDRMANQPPGTPQSVDWHSFRLAALLRRPWVHMTQVDSFWTELYARFWFEYEGIVISLRRSPEWAALRKRVDAHTGNWLSYAGWREILNWEPDDTPSSMRRVAVVSYVAGLPLTALILGGLVVAIRRSTAFAPALLALHFAGCLFVPIFQTLRLPHFAAMKSAFALGAVSSVPVFAALLLNVLPRKAYLVVLGIGGLAALVLVVANIGYIAANFSYNVAQHQP